MEKFLTYRVVKQDSAPPTSIKEMSKYKKCYLGVSLNNPFFTGKHLELFLDWTLNHFDECIIIIGDYLHRINETIQFGKYGEDAVSSARSKGENLNNIIQNIINKKPTGKFRVIFWKEFIAMYPEIIDYKVKLYEYINTNSLFKFEVEKSSSEFIQRKIDNKELLFLPKDEAIIASQEYLIEEMAVFNKFIELGYIVQIYPGTQLGILKSFANNKLDELDLDLKNGIYIDLTVKKRKK